LGIATDREFIDVSAPNRRRTCRLAGKVIKVKDNKQQTKSVCPAETDADIKLQPKITTSFRFIFRYLYKGTTIITFSIFSSFFL